MPKFNADEVQQLSEPITVTIDGKEYTVVKITTELMKKVRDLSSKPDLTADDIAIQLGLLTGTDPKEFADTDLRKMGQAIDFITEEITKGIPEKNVKADK